MSIIATIGTALPQYRAQQSDIAKFMTDLLQLREHDARRLRAIYARSGIKHRHSVIPDYGINTESRKLYPCSSDFEPIPEIEKRMELFTELALPLAQSAVNDAMDRLDYENSLSISHLITVSCTGIVAPGLDIDLINALDLSPSVQRTAINFMGCNAAFNALKIADYICNSDPNANVLIVCVELCSLHFQKNNDLDHIVANAIFADGAGAMIVLPEKKIKSKRMKIKTFYSNIDNNGRKDMAWQLSKTGFQITLTSYVPDLIENSIVTFTQNALKQLNIQPEEIRKWAIHPGGRKILESAEKGLNLTNSSLTASYTVLRKFGNMSSATTLFVLKELWDNHLSWSSRESIFALAFGPGLTMESAVLEAVNG